MTVTIVGASLAGLRVAQALRRLGFAETITLLGDEPYRPYDRPPLSKEYLDAGPDVGDAAAPPPILSDQELDALELDLRLSCPATGLDAAGRKVELASGERVGYDRLVIATGARARRHPLGAGPGGFLSLRTVDDATAIRAALDGRPQVVVLGGGFIGAEVAAAVRKRGLDVTMIEMLPAPMSRSLGPTVGTLLARLHEDHGVRVRLGTTVAAVRRDGGGRVAELELPNGSVVPADVVIEGLGATPATGWLTGNGFDVADGVACDSDLRVLGSDGVSRPETWPVARTTCSGSPPGSSTGRTPASTARSSPPPSWARPGRPPPRPTSGPISTATGSRWWGGLAPTTRSRSSKRAARAATSRSSNVTGWSAEYSPSTRQG